MILERDFFLQNLYDKNTNFRSSLIKYMTYQSAFSFFMYKMIHIKMCKVIFCHFNMGNPHIISNYQG